MLAVSVGAGVMDCSDELPSDEGSGGKLSVYVVLSIPVSDDTGVVLFCHALTVVLR